jgi:hypothetical protein
MEPKATPDKNIERAINKQCSKRIVTKNLSLGWLLTKTENLQFHGDG